MRKVPRTQQERTHLPAKVRRPIPPPPRRGSAPPRRWAGCPACCLVALAAWVVLFVAMAPRLPDTAELFAESDQAKVTVLASDGGADRDPRQQWRALRAAGRDLALAGRRR